MSNYLSHEILEEHRSVCVTFNAEQEQTFLLGDRINAQYKKAYMNGYNWAALFGAYLATYAPHLLTDLEEDCDDGVVDYFYPLSTKNKEKAHELKRVISHLIENESELFEFLSEAYEEIDWE